MKNIFILIIVVVCAGGCAMLKPAAKTVNQIARLMCIEAYGDSATGMTAEDWCNIHKNLYPFIEAVTGARDGASGADTK